MAPKKYLLQAEISFREAVAKPISPKVPKPSMSSALGSGIEKPLIVCPGVVPKEKKTELIVVGLMSGPVMTKVALLKRNGLCALLPAMLPLAFE